MRSQNTTKYQRYSPQTQLQQLSQKQPSEYNLSQAPQHGWKYFDFIICNHIIVGYPYIPICKFQIVNQSEPGEKAPIESQYINPPIYDSDKVPIVKGTGTGNIPSTSLSMYKQQHSSKSPSSKNKQSNNTPNMAAHIPYSSQYPLSFTFKANDLSNDLHKNQLQQLNPKNELNPTTKPTTFRIHLIELEQNGREKLIGFTKITFNESTIQKRTKHKIVRIQSKQKSAGKAIKNTGEIISILDVMVKVSQKNIKFQQKLLNSSTGVINENQQIKGSGTVTGTGTGTGSLNKKKSKKNQKAQNNDQQGNVDDDDRKLKPHITKEKQQLMRKVNMFSSKNKNGNGNISAAKKQQIVLSSSSQDQQSNQQQSSSQPQSSQAGYHQQNQQQNQRFISKQFTQQAQIFYHNPNKVVYQNDQNQQHLTQPLQQQGKKRKRQYVYVDQSHRVRSPQHMTINQNSLRKQVICKSQHKNEGQVQVLKAPAPLRSGHSGDYRRLQLEGAASTGQIRNISPVRDLLMMNQKRQSLPQAHKNSRQLVQTKQQQQSLESKKLQVSRLLQRQLQRQREYQQRARQQQKSRRIRQQKLRQQQLRQHYGHNIIKPNDFNKNSNKQTKHIQSQYHHQPPPQQQHLSQDQTHLSQDQSQHPQSQAQYSSQSRPQDNHSYLDYKLFLDLKNNTRNENYPEVQPELSYETMFLDKYHQHEMQQYQFQKKLCNSKRARQQQQQQQKLYDQNIQTNKKYHLVSHKTVGGVKKKKSKGNTIHFHHNDYVSYLNNKYKNNNMNVNVNDVNVNDVNDINNINNNQRQEKYHHHQHQQQQQYEQLYKGYKGTYLKQLELQRRRIQQKIQSQQQSLSRLYPNHQQQQLSSQLQQPVNRLHNNIKHDHINHINLSPNKQQPLQHSRHPLSYKFQQLMLLDDQHQTQIYLQQQARLHKYFLKTGGYRYLERERDREGVRNMNGMGSQYIPYRHLNKKYPSGPKPLLASANKLQQQNSNSRYRQPTSSDKDIIVGREYLAEAGKGMRVGNRGNPQRQKERLLNNSLNSQIVQNNNNESMGGQRNRLIPQSLRPLPQKPSRRKMIQLNKTQKRGLGNLNSQSKQDMRLLSNSYEPILLEKSSRRKKKSFTLPNNESTNVSRKKAKHPLLLDSIPKPRPFSNQSEVIVPSKQQNHHLYCAGDQFGQGAYINNVGSFNNNYQYFNEFRKYGHRSIAEMIDHISKNKKFKLRINSIEILKKYEGQGSKNGQGNGQANKHQIEKFTNLSQALLQGENNEPKKSSSSPSPSPSRLNKESRQGQYYTNTDTDGQNARFQVPEENVITVSHTQNEDGDQAVKLKRNQKATSQQENQPSQIFLKIFVEGRKNTTEFITPSKYMIKESTVLQGRDLQNHHAKMLLANKISKKNRVLSHPNNNNSLPAKKIYEYEHCEWQLLCPQTAEEIQHGGAIFNNIANYDFLMFEAYKDLSMYDYHQFAGKCIISVNEILECLKIQKQLQSNKITGYLIHKAKVNGHLTFNVSIAQQERMSINTTKVKKKKSLNK